MEDCARLETECDLEVMNARLQFLSTNMWWVEASTMPKLRAFIQIHNNYQNKIPVLKNLWRNHGSLTVKLKEESCPYM